MNISGFSPSSSNYYSSVGNRPERSVAANGEVKKESAEPEKKSGELSPEEANQVAKLKETDRKVRMHEAAHMAAGGGMITSGASYTYQKGPDGVSYATGGEVGIDTSPGKTPEETISRAQRIRAAALAPADPSGQDLAVAAQATQMEQQARMEAAEQRRQENSGQGKVEGFYGAQPAKAGNQVSTYA
jgi:hypothetical protein